MTQSNDNIVNFTCTQCGKGKLVPSAHNASFTPPPAGWMEQSFFIQKKGTGITRAVSFPFCSLQCKTDAITDPAVIPDVVAREIKRLEE